MGFSFLMRNVGAFTKSMSALLEVCSFTGKMVGREGGRGCGPGEASSWLVI